MSVALVGSVHLKSSSIMDQDLLEALLFGSGPASDAMFGKNSWTLESSEIDQLAHFLPVDLDYSRANQCPLDLTDVFNLDIPLQHEFLLNLGPEAAPQLFSESSGTFPDLSEYGAMDWSPVLDDLGVGAGMTAATADSMSVLCASVKQDNFFADQDAFFLEQLVRELQPALFSTDSNSKITECHVSSISTNTFCTSEMSPVSVSVPSFTPPLSPSPLPLVPTAESTPKSPRRAKPIRKQTPPASIAGPSQRRPYVRRNSSTMSTPSPSPSTSSNGSHRRMGTKVTPKKRTQNRKAAGDYRQRKKVIEEERQEEHEALLKVRDGLKEQNSALLQELKFAVKMAEARLKKMVDAV